MNDELPDGWSTATVEELTGAGGLMTDGDWIESKDQSPDGDVRLIQLADIGDGEFIDKSARYLTSQTAGRLNCTYLHNGDLLVARMPDPLGRACIFPGVGQPSITAVDVCVWRSGDDGSAARWLMHTINSPQVRAEILALAGGTTRQRISGGNLKRLCLPVPPLPEQHRIVTKIDSLFTRSSRARDELARIPKLIERYRQAVLEAAFNGDLTADWRAPQGLGSWRQITVQEIADNIFDGPFGSNLKSDDYTEGGVRVVRLENIGHMSFVADKKTYITEGKYHQLLKHTLVDGDVMFSSFVSEQTRVCLFPGGLPVPAINKADCFCVRLNREQCLPEFLMYRLSAQSAFDYMQAQVHGATRPRVNLGHLKKFTFSLPSLTEQAEIIRRISTAFASIERIEAEKFRAEVLSRRLDQSILDKAFTGKLVPQDPTDEPASKLLERIQAARAAAPKAKRGRKATG